MKLKGVMTEKSTKLIKDRGYTFLVPTRLTKNEIKSLIEKTFGVHVTDVKTINSKARTKKNMKGHNVKIKAVKKAIVFIKEKEKIELFEEEKKAKKKRSVKK